MRNQRTALALPLLVLIAGCPGDPGTGKDGTAPVSSQLPATGKLPKPPRTNNPDKVAEKPVEAPLDLLGFTKETLAELYRADVLADETGRRAVQKKHGLVDDAGKPTPRSEAYERALQRFAEKRPDEWSALVEEIEKARATRPATADVSPR